MGEAFLASVGRVFGARDDLSRPAGVLPSGAAGLPALPAPASSVDLRRFCTYVDDQIGNQCVADSGEGLRWIAVGGQGRRASSRGPYVGARVRERARKTDPIPDTGCQVGDYLDTLLSPGTYSRDARDDDSASLDAMDTWDEEVACRTFVEGDFVSLEAGDFDSLDAWLTLGASLGDRGTAAQFIMSVDRAYEALASAQYTGPTGPSLGLHAQAVVGYTGRAASDWMIVWNTWGASWGAGGFCMIRRGSFQALARVAPMTVIRGGPTF